MKILYLTPFDPTLQDGGGYLRSSLMWRALKSIGEVDTIVVRPGDQSYAKPEDRVWCVSLQPVFRFGWRLSRFKFLSTFLRRMNWAFLDRSEILKRLGCSRDDYDCVVVRLERVARWSAAWKIAPMYLDLDDLPSESFQTMQMSKFSRFKGLVLLFLEKRWERFLARQCAGVWLCNSDKREALPSSVRKLVLQNLGHVPSVHYRLKHQHNNSILSVGTFAYGPNIVGIEWFLKEIWPSVIAEFPQLVLNIVGNLPEGVKEAARRWASIQGVRVLGFVENIEQLYESALCTLGAATSGSGTSVKVIESALFGRTVLATPFSARGLNAEKRDKMGVSLFSCAEDFSKNISMLLNESIEERDARQCAIHLYAKGVYSFSGFRETVVDMLSSSLNTSPK